jgi:hypothetical protein
MLAVVALVPAVWRSDYPSYHASQPARLAFFTDGLYKSCIPRNETVTIFPFGYNGDSLLYQAETDFRFRMAENNLQPLPAAGHKAWASFDDDWVVMHLNAGSDQPTTNSLLAFAAIHHIDRFISIPTAGFPYPSAAVMRSLGPTERIGGVLVSPACGQPSLVTRNLTSVVQTYLQQRQSNANIAYCLGSNLDTLSAGLTPSGPLQGAKPASFVAGQGLACLQPAAGYKRHGFATAAMNVPAGIYPLSEP